MFKKKLIICLFTYLNENFKPTNLKIVIQTRNHKCELSKAHFIQLELSEFLHGIKIRKIAKFGKEAKLMLNRNMKFNTSGICEH